MASSDQQVSPREALDRTMLSRLLAHIENGTTDLAAAVLEVDMSCYGSVEHYEAELDVLFRNHPLVLGLSGALPGPNTTFATDVLGIPIVLTRDAEGTVRSFLNACRHRGVRLVDGIGTGRRITCPFHAWTYDLAGNLVGLPVSEGFEGMCREHKGLVELPVAEAGGLLIGRVTPGDPIDLDAFLGAELVAELDLLDVSAMELYSEPHVHEVAANWKVTLDTFRENYHFDYLHRDTLAPMAHGGVLTFDPLGQHLRNCSVLRSADELLGTDPQGWGEVAHHFTYQYAIFPNTSLTVAADHLELWQILPTGPDSSVVLHAAYGPAKTTADERAATMERIAWICEAVVDGEDFWVAGRTEPAVRLGMFDTVVFGRNEPAPQHLHRGYEAALAAAGRLATSSWD